MRSGSPRGAPGGWIDGRDAAARRALAEREGLAVYMLLRDGEGFEARHSRAFGPYLGPDAGN